MESATALILAEAGADVAVCDRKIEGGEMDAVAVEKQRGAFPSDNYEDGTPVPRLLSPLPVLKTLPIWHSFLPPRQPTTSPVSKW